MNRSNILQIGSVPTPWPSWLIAAHPERAETNILTPFLDGLSSYVNAFNSEESRKNANVPFIEQKFGYPKEDIEVISKEIMHHKIHNNLFSVGLVKNGQLSPELLRNPGQRYY